jgi:hypothetical protein
VRGPDHDDLTSSEAQHLVADRGRLILRTPPDVFIMRPESLVLPEVVFERRRLGQLDRRLRQDHLRRAGRCLAILVVTV